MQESINEINEKIEKMKKGLAFFDDKSIKEILRKSIINAEQTIANLKETERLITSNERMNLQRTVDRILFFSFKQSHSLPHIEKRSGQCS